MDSSATLPKIVRISLVVQTTDGGVMSEFESVYWALADRKERLLQLTFKAYEQGDDEEASINMAEYEVIKNVQQDMFSNLVHAAQIDIATGGKVQESKRRIKEFRALYRKQEGGQDNGK